MKIPYFTALLLFGVLNSLGQQGVGPTNTRKPNPASTESGPYSIIQQDANSRIWASTNYEQLPSGESVPQVRTYTELGTGLNYQQGNEWKESQERIEPQATGGGAALLGQHKVFFPYDLYQGVIETVTLEGTHLRSRPLGISYFDGSNSVLIAELTNSVGQILSSGNQVIYTNAFTDFAADLLISYRKGGVECDLIIRTQPPGPEQFGLNPETSRLEMLTEFFNPPEPSLKGARVNPHSGLEDSTIEFGSMQMIAGKAFILGDQNNVDVPVAKTWAHLNGRTFLIEEVPVLDVKTQLQQLPATPNGNSAAPGRGRRTASLARQLPAQRFATVSTNAIQMAKANVANQPGFALDYNMVVAQTNFTFQADTTYYVRDPVNLSGTTTIEGNTVIKCVTNLGPSINILGTINCATAPYRPAIITSSQDNTVAEAIPAPFGNTNSPYILYMTNTANVGGNFYVWEYDTNGGYHYFNQNSYYGDYFYPGGWLSYAINFTNSSILNFSFSSDDGGGGYISVTPLLRDGHVQFYEYSPYTSSSTLTYSESGASLGSPAIATGLSLANGGSLHDLRFCNLSVGVSSSTNYSITNAQFVNCGTGLKIQNATLFAGNILMYNVGTALAGQSYQATVEHLTYDQGTQVTTNSSGSSSVLLINSLITGLTNYGNATITTNTVRTSVSSSGVYQTVGGGSHYLGTNIYRGIGTNLDAGMAWQLAQKTTFPPIAYTNAIFTNALVFPLQATRDTNAAPDLGYHYDPLDYTFGGCSANSNLTFNAGVAAGWFRKTSGTFHAGYGLHPTNGVIVAFNGTITAPDYWVRLNTVQEQDITAGTGTAGIDGWATNIASAPVLQATYLRASTMASESGGHFAYTDGHLNAQLTHSELWGGSIGGGVGNFGGSLSMTNCLADRVSITAYGTNASVVMRNTTIRGGKLTVTHLSGFAWPADVSDCAFDSTTISVNAGGNTNLIHYAYNAFRTNANRLTPTNATDVVITNFNWQTGLLGSFYLPSNSVLIDKGHTNANLAGLYHFTTQTNQMKETNSIVDIGYHYVALNGNGKPMDSDGDGLADYLEDVNGNGVYDGGDLSDWGNADTDGDGLSDGYEINHGSNPLQFDNLQLGLWRFDNTFTWQGDYGQNPIIALNVTGISSWDTNAVLVDTNTTAVLSYRDIEPIGTANITVPSGSVRFWFRPDWSSTNAGGTGPKSDARFVELDSKGSTNGWWSLSVDAYGTNLYFGTQTNSTATLTTNVSLGISWISNVWHEAVLTYSASNSSLYIDGQPAATNGAGVSVYPGVLARSQGFTIGSSSWGTNQARGAFDDLETFNYPLSASAISSNYNAKTQLSDTNGLYKLWELNHFGHLGVDPNDDPDGDGVSNAGEMVNGTDPFVFNNARLGYWRFNDSPLWRDEQGLLPTLAQGLVPIPSWSVTAVKIDTHFNAVLSYPGVRTNGSQVLYRPSGTIRFWFKPTWNSSVDEGGNGPGDTVRLFEIGRKSDDAIYGWLGLTVNTLGNRLDLISQAGGIENVNASAYSTFASNTWYQITVTYSTNICAIYIDGQNFTTNGVGLTNSPSTTLWQQGFNFGSTADALHQANGSFEELETFNYVLTSSNILADFSAQMSVLAVDGLPITVADGLGLRLDAVDTDCDGLPDAWEIANGLNPKDQTDATPAMLSLYASGGSARGPLYLYSTAKSNIWNVAFVSNAGSALGSSMLGAMVRGTNGSGVVNDIWNFADIGADFMGGVSLRDANSNSTGVKLFAYLGPCTNEFLVHPKLYTNIFWSVPIWTYSTNFSGGSGEVDISVRDFETVRTVTYLNNAKSDIDFLNYGLNVNDFRLDLWYQQWITNSWGVYNDWFLIDNPGGPYNGYYERIWVDSNGITHNDYVYRVPISTYLGWWYYPALATNNCSAGALFGLPYRFQFYSDDGVNLNGPYFSLSDQSAADLSLGFSEATAYARTLGSFLYASNFYTSGAGFAPAGCANIFLQPFESVSHSTSVLAGNDGAAWRFAGDTSKLSTNVAGGWFKTFYPGTKRNVVFEGIPSGTYKVIVYFDCRSDLPRVAINDVVPAVMQTGQGTRYWYATVEPSSYAPITSAYSGIRAEAPISVITGQGTNGCIKLQIDPINAYDANADVKILGFQIIRDSDASSLEARPGSGAIYLNWGGNTAATGYQIYRSVGNTNSWTLIGATASKTYADTNLTAGIRYYYQVTSTNVSGSLGSSSVADAISFQCLSPLPPRIDFVQTLHLPEENGSYPLPFECLMTNSDAMDPQGYPLTFKIQSVLAGSLMINGAPFGPGNITISNLSSVVWTPPTMLLPTNAAALRVYVDDGVNRSTNTVDVVIQQHPKLYLVSWGNNRSGQAGNGLLHISIGDDTGPTNYIVGSTSPQIIGAGSGNMGSSNYYDLLFEGQNALGILPRDPRWDIMIDWSNHCEPAKRVLDLDKVTSIASWHEETWPGVNCAVTPDGKLWVWGQDEAYRFGQPLVVYSNNVYTWNSDTAPHTYRSVVPYTIDAPSPTPFLDPATHSQMTGVVTAKNGFIIKSDGSLWSIGATDYEYGIIGRDPQPPTDLANWYDGRGQGILPNRVEIDGNNSSGITPGREIVDIETGLNSALARCKDGTIWWWGTLVDWGSDDCNGHVDTYSAWVLTDGGGYPDWLPRRLTSVEVPGAAPIKQVSAAVTHYVFLREDGSVQELGYIPSLDPYRPDWLGWGCSMTTLGDCYSVTPVAVTGLPRNICQISAAWNFTAALTDTGEVWVWGHWNSQTVTTPLKVGNLSDITKIVSGNQFLLALDRFGRVWGAGRNEAGVFGYHEVGPNNNNQDDWYLDGLGSFYTNAVRVVGVENAADIFLGGSPYNLEPTAFAIGTEVQGKPIGLKAVGRDRRVSLSWQKYSGASSYIIYRSINRDEGYTPIGQATDFSYDDQPLSNGQTYYYEVSAVVNGVETARSWEAEATPYQAPGPVTSLTASWACHGVKLQWLAPTNVSSSPLDEYQILVNGVWLADLPSITTLYFDDTAISGSNYTYTVVAFNSSGAASNSISPTGTIPCDPAPYVSTDKDYRWVSVTAGQYSDNATVEWAGPTNAQLWLYQPTEFDMDPVTGQNTMDNFIGGVLFSSDSSSEPGWLWSQFVAHGVDTNTLLSYSAPVSTRVSALIAGLNQVLTNGQSVSNLSVFSTTIGNFPYRPATSNLFYTYPTGTNLVRLKRMLLDDALYGACFARGGNWGTNLTGFRLHYRLVQYINGHRSERFFQRDVTLADVQYDHSGIGDGYNLHAGTYKYTWTIPKGALCWASISAVVNGEESEISGETGPGLANYDPYQSWDASLRAIPGDHQIYLDWKGDTSAFSYNLYYTTNSNDTNNWDPGSGSWQLVPGASGIALTRFWHTNLAVGTTNYYEIVPNDYFASSPISQDQITFAVVTNVTSTTNWFAADAAAYDSMVLVEWTVPTNQYTTNVSLSQTNWQFFLERKDAAAGDSSYQLLTEVGYGLAYLDTEVINGQSYTYRVTAFDQSFNRIQALALLKGGSSSAIKPSSTNGLTLLPPQPGNAYVDLTWSPIRATQFVIKRSLSPDSLFEAVGSVNVSDAYQNAHNTYRDLGLQNGVTYYYQIVATTPTGFEISSDIKGAMPLSTLAPLPPTQFKANVTQINGTNTVQLSWLPANGASQYQLFIQNNVTLLPLFNTSATSASYGVPSNVADNEVLTFAVRSMNAQGIVGDVVMTSVTNQPTGDAPTPVNPVQLKIDGIVTNAMAVMGPTNLTLSVDINLPGVTLVSFYCDGKLIGTVNSMPFQYTWNHVPGGSHQVTAAAYVQSVSISTGTISVAFTSDPCALNVTVEPQLSAYQTAATDLQLPVPALPIVLARSYNSRSTETNAVLGVGWTPSWSVSSVQFSANLFTNGWTAVSQAGFAGANYYYISETNGHYVTVTLPGGQNAMFGALLDYDSSQAYYGDPAILNPDYTDPPEVNVSFSPLDVNSGTFSTSLRNLTIANLAEGNAWSGPVEFIPEIQTGISYTTPEGAVYQFDRPLTNDASNLKWLLTRQIDRNGNSLTYNYNSDNTIQAISNSCGRSVRFAYANPGGNTNILHITAFDMMGTNLVYVVSNHFLTEVRQMVDRNAGTFQTNFYVYGTDISGHPADFSRITEVYDARGIRVLKNSYTNANGDLAVQISPGRTNTFVFDSSTYNLTVTSASSTGTNTAMVTSDASGAISGATQPTAGTSASGSLAAQVSYDAQGNVVGQTDANGNTKTYAYDSLNRLVGQSDENGNSSSTELNSYGQPTISTDANGSQTLYEYDGNGNPTNVRDPSGTSTTYGYSNPVTNSTVAFLGSMQTSQMQTAPFVPYTIATLNTYKTTGSILGDLLTTTEQWQDSAGTLVGKALITSYQYDTNGNRTVEIKQRTVSTGIQYITNIYTYDALNRVVQTIIGAAGAETLPPQTNFVIYNALGKQAISVDAAGRTNTSTYDFNGNLIETKSPDGTVTRTSYDGFGRQQYVQDRAIPNGSDATTAPATLSIYDASGRVTNSVRLASVTLTKTSAVQNTDFVGLGTVAAFKMVASSPGTALSSNLTFFDAVGRVQYSVDAHGAVTENRYDAAGRRTNTLVYTQNAYAGTLPPGGATQSTTYSYDANGNQVTVTDALGHTTTSVYDAANRLIETDYPAPSGTTSRTTAFDGLGRKISETDEAGVVTAYTYDFRGLLTSVTLAAGTTQAVTTVYQYDELGNEIKQTDAAGHATAFRYDALGRRVGRTLPAGQSESYAYDLTGNMVYQTNFNGVVITNQYDGMNRLTNRLSAGGYQASYAYNPTNGQRTGMTDVTGTTTYQYDLLNRLTQKTVAWSNGPTVSLNYGYEVGGLLTNLWSSTVNGVTNAYQYDLLGRLTNVIASGNAAASYGFDAVGNLQSMRFGSGVTNLYQYDSRNLLTNLVWKLNTTSLASFAYTVGSTGNRTALAELLNGTSRTYGWTYDLLYRMTGETMSGIGAMNYQFDTVGNRTNRTSTVSGLNNQAFIYNPNDWLTNTDTYDSNGNTTASAGTTYQYDVLNHLTNANGNIVIGYDGDGNRVKKAVSGTTTYYLLDDRNPSGYVQVVEEYQGSSLSTLYNYGLDLISQKQITGSIIRYFGYEGHGSTRFLTDTSGSVTDTYVYDAYGNKITAASTGSSVNKYLYCGEQFDSDLNQYYLRARYYTSDTGRFGTMDSLEGNREDPLSLHKYLYCRGNPVNRCDPLGLADYTLVIAYAGVDTGTGRGFAGDPETWGGGIVGVGHAMIGDTIGGQIVVGPVGDDDKLYDAVKAKVQVFDLTPGTDRITKVIIVGHGGKNGSIGTWNSSSPSSITLDSLQSKTTTDQQRLMSYLHIWTSGHCEVKLQACYQASSGRPQSMMQLMAKMLGATVTGYDDEYAVVGWGNEWTVDPNGNWTMKKGKPFNGSWADLNTWSSTYKAVLDLFPYSGPL